MKIIQAQAEDLEIVRNIVRSTINSVYPHYYPVGAVKYFLDWHSGERIASDLESGNVFILTEDDLPVGTVTINENEINRLFVLQEFQGKGFGRALMDFAEEKIATSYDRIRLDASFPAKQIYLKRGYADVGYEKIPCENGDWLCHDTMEKIIR